MNRRRSSIPSYQSLKPTKYKPNNAESDLTSPLKLTIHNRTHFQLYLRSQPPSSSPVLPSLTSVPIQITTDLARSSKASFNLVFAPSSSTSFPSHTFLFSAPHPPAQRTAGSKQASWKRADLLGSNDARFWALQSRSDDASSTLDILLLPFRDPQFFLSTLPSDLPLSSICLPGTHESLALYGWPISTCQSASSSVLHQLKEGIRFLDVRLSIKGKGTDSRLLAYHGITDQRIPFDQVLEQCFDFLRGHGGETLIMSIKQENNVEGFKEMVMEKYVHPTQDFWFLSPRVPTLGECRGKIVLLSRFGRGDEQPGGIHPPIWPNSSKEIFSYKLPSGQTVETQDWYDISSLSNLDSKQELIERLLVSSGSDPEILSLNFCSASSFPLALPPFAAKGFLTGGPKCLSKRGINSRLFDVICDRLRYDFPSRTTTWIPEEVRPTATTITTSEKSTSSSQANFPDRRHGQGEKVEQTSFDENHSQVSGARRIPTSNFLMCVFLLDYFEEPEASKDLVSLMIEANFGI